MLGVGIYPPNASDRDHGAQNNRWKWLRDIDVSNASFSRGAAGPRSIRVFSDGGYTLHARKDFDVEAAQKPRRGRIGFAALFGILLMLPGLPLLIIGSISTAEDRLAMIIPGAMLMCVGGFTVFMSVAAAIRMGRRKDLRPWRGQEVRVAPQRTSNTIVQSSSTRPIQHRQPSRDNDAWVGLYPAMRETRTTATAGSIYEDIDVNNATLPGQEQGAWSLRLFSDGRYTLDHRVDFELEPAAKKVWMREAEFGDQRLNGLIPDHRNNFTKKVTTSKIVAQHKVGNLTHLNGRHNIPGLRPRLEMTKPVLGCQLKPEFIHNGTLVDLCDHKGAPRVLGHFGSICENHRLRFHTGILSL